MLFRLRGAVMLLYVRSSGTTSLSAFPSVLVSRRAQLLRDEGAIGGVIKLIEAAGWEISRTRGSHRQYRHLERPALVTIAGKPSDTLHPKTWASVAKQAGLTEHERWPSGDI